MSANKCPHCGSELFLLEEEIATFECGTETQFGFELFRPIECFNRAHIAQLAAVTAERDRLKEALSQIANIDVEEDDAAIKANHIAVDALNKFSQTGGNQMSGNNEQAEIALRFVLEVSEMMKKRGIRKAKIDIRKPGKIKFDLAPEEENK